MLLRHGDLTLDAPEGWEDRSQLIVAGPQEDGFHPNLVVTWAPAEKGESPGQFAAKALPLLQRSLQKLQVRKEGPTLIGDRSAFWREYTFELEGKQVGQLQVFLASGHRIYTLTFSHLAARLEGARPLAKRLFESVELDALGGKR